MEPVRILLVDDHPIVRQGINSLLSNYPEFAIVGEAEDGAGAMALIESTEPDVILLDIRMPGESGLVVLKRILQIRPEARVLMLTSFDEDEYVIGALRAGAQGFVLKSVSDEKLVSAIKAVCRGERVFSPQITDRVVQYLISEQPIPPEQPLLDEDEYQILRLLAKGATNADIASAMYLSPTTVKRKLRHIFDQMGVNSRTEAAVEAVRRGMV
ncbi:MAG: response regulator transcription factor [Candidatus Promineifilaceae bacterium]